MSLGTQAFAQWNNTQSLAGAIRGCYINARFTNDAAANSYEQKQQRTTYVTNLNVINVYKFRRCHFAHSDSNPGHFALWNVTWHSLPLGLRPSLTVVADRLPHGVQHLGTSPNSEPRCSCVSERVAEWRHRLPSFRRHLNTHLLPFLCLRHR